jgi:hypothetical protein
VSSKQPHFSPQTTLFPWADSWLASLEQLIVPDGPWKMPLVRAVMPCPAAAAFKDTTTLTITVGVYFTRLVRMRRPPAPP